MSKPYLLFVGNAKPHKNLQRLLTAYARCGSCHDVDLILCAPRDNLISSWVDELDLGRKVRITGLLDDPELSGYYRGAVALLFPTLYEGFGMPALEAMACGTPVLSSAATSLPEVTGDAALVIDPLDIESITAGIERLIDDSDLRGDLRLRGLKRAKLFSWDATAGVVRGVIEEVADSSD